MTSAPSSAPAMPLRALLLALPLLLLAGCDIPGLGPDPKVVQREAEAKAIGSACRHALRGIEDCYNLNPKANKALVFVGWKEMDQYMRENKIEGQKTAIVPSQPAAKEPKEEVIEDDGHKSAGKATEPRAAKAPGGKPSAS